VVATASSNSLEISKAFCFSFSHEFLKGAKSTVRSLFFEFFNG
jgi:hypothetical protein